MATTITIADGVHPKHTGGCTTSADDGVGLTRTATGRSLAQDGGIYNIRSRSRAVSRDAGFSRVLPHPTTDEDPGIRKDGDLRTAQVFGGKMLLWLAYQSIGVIYGDIGTSPLYVYSSTFTEPPTRKDLLGVLSLILWSLIMTVTLKYITIILRADNDGEGGTFSTYALLSRFVNITNRDPREASLVRMSRWHSGDLESAGRKVRRGMKSSNLVRGLLKLMGVLAVSIVMADGVLTPAQSVLGAVQGIEVVDPTLSKGVIIGTTDAILVVLFLIQPLGITKITFLFSPIDIVWLGFNAAFVVYNLARYDGTMFKAFNPGYAFGFLIDHKEGGWRQLGSTVLAFTGVEALFAVLGAFSRRAVQLSWLCYTFPCLLLAYIGQAAFISVHPEAYDNSFFKAAPPGTIYPSLVIAILAAIVASQAIIITATFQLLAQIMKLSYFPQLRVVHTSKIFHGHLYIPLANWSLMIGTILIASIYHNTTRLGNAYGVCVMFVTSFDTVMTSLVFIFCYRFNPWLVAFPWLVFACLDGTFLSSALTKVPAGAWFTLTLATILGGLFLVWRYGKEQQWFAEAEDRFPTSHFVRKNSEHEVTLTERFGSTPISHVRGCGIFFDEAGETTPIVFSNFITKLTVAPEVMIFFHLRPLEVPSVPSDERHTVSRLAIPNCYRLVVRYGYNDEVITPNLAAVVLDQLRLYLLKCRDTPNVRKVSTSTPIKDQGENEVAMTNMDEGDEEIAWKRKLEDERLSEELTRLDRAFNHKALYIIGNEQMKIKHGTNVVRTTLLKQFLWIRDNTRNKMANLNVPKDGIIEVGFLKEI